jgi:hypothetical protein
MFIGHVLSKRVGEIYNPIFIDAVKTTFCVIDLPGKAIIAIKLIIINIKIQAGDNRSLSAGFPLTSAGRCCYFSQPVWPE